MKSLTLITNQCFETGLFPDKLKIDNVIPLCKKDDKTLMENYRPVSILPAISKVIEQIMFRKNNYFTINIFFYKSHMLLDKNITHNLLHIDCLIE